MVYILLGIIIGLLLNPSKEKVIKILHEYKKDQEDKGTTQFYEPVTDKERFESAKSVDDLLES